MSFGLSSHIHDPDFHNSNIEHDILKTICHKAKFYSSDFELVLIIPRQICIGGLKAIVALSTENV